MISLKTLFIISCLPPSSVRLPQGARWLTFQASFIKNTGCCVFYNYKLSSDEECDKRKAWFWKETIDSWKRRRNNMPPVLCKYHAFMIWMNEWLYFPDWINTPWKPCSLLFLFTESKSTVTLLPDKNIKLNLGDATSRRIEKNVDRKKSGMARFLSKQ